VNNEAPTFEQVILPHLDAAYNLARWLAGDDHDAQDIVQESCLRAVKHFNSYRGGNPRAWLLAIVRNTSYTWLSRDRRVSLQAASDEESIETEDLYLHPAALQDSEANIEKVRAAIALLAPEFREVITLREIEEYSYKEIADIVEAPIGTVMSRLARARRQLQKILTASPGTLS